MLIRLFRWLFYIIIPLLALIWSFVLDIFTQDNLVHVWDWYISWDSESGFINAIINSITILSIPFAIECFIFLIRLWHDKNVAKKLIYMRVRLTRTDSKIDDEKRSEKDFKEKIAIMQQFYRAIHEIWEINIWNKITTWIWQDDFVSFELFLENKQVHFYVVTQEKYASIIEKQISSFYPNANFFIEKMAYKFRPHWNKVWGYNFKTVLPFWDTIKMYDTMEHDPLNDLANVLSKVWGTETAVFQVIVHPIADKDWKEKAEKKASDFFSKKEGDGFFSRLPIIWPVIKFIAPVFSDSSLEKSMAPWASSWDSYVRMLAPKEDYAKHMWEKAWDVSFETTIRILASTASRKRSSDLLRNMIVAMNLFKENYWNFFDASRIIIIEPLNAILIYISFQNRLKNFFNWVSILCAKELAWIFHFPDSKYNNVAIIKWMDYKILPPPSDIPKDGLLIWINNYRGYETPIYINEKDRSRHFYIIWKSWSWKSALISYLARQDAKNWNWFWIIDPHWDLVEDVIKFIPKERAKDVVIFNPGDEERPMWLNILEAKTPWEKDRASLDAMEIFIKLFWNEIFGPRIQHYFRNAVLTLMDDEDEWATLLDVPRMFIDEEFQKRKVAKCKNTVVRSFWENEIAKTGQREKEEMIPYFSSKFWPFVTNTTIRNIIGQQKSAFDIRKIMDEGKILLVNLSKWVIWNLNAQLLWLIFVNKVSMAAMSRANIPEDQRRPFYLYVDEFQNFATWAFADILSEARKYKLALIMAHQYIAQLSESWDMSYEKWSKVKDAVFGNVWTMMNFKVWAEDAEYFEKEYAPVLSAQDILGIANHKAYMKLNINNTTSRPFSISTIWDDSWSDKVAGILKEYSRMKYWRKKVFVDQEIEARLGI